jgi:preprotein translocase subunit SecY
MAVGLILFICFMERALAPVADPISERQTARGAIQQERSHLPIKVNVAGVIRDLRSSLLLMS